MSRYLALVVLLIFSSQAAAQSPSFLGKDLPDWVQQLESRDAQDRHEAAWAIAQLGLPAANILLDGALKNEDPVVRFWCVHGLGKIAMAKEVPRNVRAIVVATMEFTLKDLYVSVRIAAADQLARLGQVEEALPALIAGLEDPQESAGQQAAAALVAMGKRAAPARAKLEVAAEKGGEYVKRLATKALAQLQE